jgi:tetratricopeptide (TPR) repeat protein
MLFLKNIRKDYDRAEELYKKLLELDPKDANYTGGYANFLHNIRMDYDGAEELYKKSLELDPDHANNVGNYAGFLLSRGDKKGFDYVDKALELAADDSVLAVLVLECRFYLYAHSPDDKIRNQSLAIAKSFLIDGLRSPDFDLSQNVERAIQDEHPEPKSLEKLAKVIAAQADISELDQFEVWRNSGTETSES